MKKIENFFGNGGFDLSKVITQIVIAIIIIIIFAILLAIGQLAFLIQIFVWIESKIRVFTGLDALLAKALTSLIMGGLLALPIWKIFFSFLPVPQKNKGRNRLIIMSILALMFFLLFFASRQVYFNSNSGEPMKYYSVSPSGEYKFYSSGGYDPVTGDKLEPITKDIVIKHLNGNLNSNAKTSTGNDYSSSGVIKLNIKNQSGIEKVADFYEIKIINGLDEKVFFVISARVKSESEVHAFPLAAKSSIALSVCEGLHYFGFMDINGEDRLHRDDGLLLLTDFLNYHGYLGFMINGSAYQTYYNRSIFVPERKEIRLSYSTEGEGGGIIPYKGKKPYYRKKEI